MFTGAVFSGSTLYIADFAHGSILGVQKGGEQEVIVGVYEDKPLKGPNSIVSDSIGNLFFTDSGPLGETGVHSPTGSLFMISGGPTGQILKPLCLEKLAYPSGLAVSPTGKFIYVAEMMTNRVLRFFQQPEGVYHGSVFYQMSGGVGPTGLVCDRQGSLYVACYDTRDSANDGKVLVVSPSGSLLTTIIVSSGPEISGIAISDNLLYITEKSTGSIYQASL